MSSALLSRRCTHPSGTRKTPSEIFIAAFFSVRSCLKFISVKDLLTWGSVILATAKSEHANVCCKYPCFFSPEDRGTGRPKESAISFNAPCVRNQIVGGLPDVTGNVVLSTIPSAFILLSLFLTWFMLVSRPKSLHNWLSVA